MHLHSPLLATSANSIRSPRSPFSVTPRDSISVVEILTRTHCGLLYLGAKRIRTWKKHTSPGTLRFPTRKPPEARNRILFESTGVLRTALRRRICKRPPENFWHALTIICDSWQWQRRSFSAIAQSLNLQQQNLLSFRIVSCVVRSGLDELSTEYCHSVSVFFLVLDTETVSKNNLGAACFHIYPWNNLVFFCLFVDADWNETSPFHSLRLKRLLCILQVSSDGYINLSATDCRTQHIMTVLRSLHGDSIRIGIIGGRPGVAIVWALFARDLVLIFVNVSFFCRFRHMFVYLYMSCTHIYCINKK